MMPMFISPESFSTVRVRVVVLPLPGELIRFSRKQCCLRSSSRSTSAASSFALNMLCFIS